MTSDSVSLSRATYLADIRQSAQRWVDLSERIGVCSRQLRSLLGQHSADLTLGEAQLSVLWACLESPTGGWSQRELAHTLAVSPAHVSGLVEQLRCQGLLAGRRNIHDRRRQQWQLTPAGRAKLQSLFEGLTSWAMQLDSQFDPTELLALTNRLSETLSSGSLAGKLCDEFDEDAPSAGGSAVGPVQKRGAA